MDRLIDELRALDPDAPKAVIDLDAVIARGLRRRRNVRLAAVLAAAVTALTATTLALVLPGEPVVRPMGPVPSLGCTAATTPGGAQPTAAAQSARSLPEPSAAAARLREVIAQALMMALAPAVDQAVPSGVTVLDGQSCRDQWFLTWLDAGNYTANLDLVDGQGTSRLHIRISAQSPPAEASCAKNSSTTTCTRSVLADGTVLYELHTDYGDAAATTQFDVYRPDGTAVFVAIDNYRLDQNLQQPGPVIVTLTRPTPTLSTEALRTLALTPALTLFL